MESREAEGFQQRVHPPKKIPLLHFGIALVVIVAIVVIAYAWYRGHNRSVFETSSPVLLTPVAVPLFPAAVLDPSTKKITPITEPAAGTASIIGYAKEKNRAFYLLTENNSATSNIYGTPAQSDLKGLQQFSFTKSLKLQLSYDAATDALAFAELASSTATSSRIMYLPHSTTTPVQLAMGNNPVLIKGGAYVIYDDGKTIFSINPLTRRIFTLLSIPNGATYTVDPQESRIALLDPNAKTIQYFSIKSGYGASAERVEQVPYIRSSMRALLASKGVQIFELDKQGIFVVHGVDKKDVTRVDRNLIPITALYQNAHFSVYEK
jgi:hypothetical protein